MMIQVKKVKLLETTLRDGSYTINYQFNANETRYIAKILDEIGFEYIEIGPGIGFNAKRFSEHPPASSDEEYIQAAREVVKNGKIGMFFIPGIARSTDIDMAAANKLDIIRIGTNIDNYKQGFKYLSLCKKNGIETASNLMKSYAVEANEFAEIANECYKAGADFIYLVDSAGGMFPEDIKRFILQTKNLNPDIKMGFHGHDNLGLAIANTLTAIEYGADIVDSSIRGMGRSSGNAITEKLIFVLKRLGYHMPYDINKLLELSDKVILNYLSGKPEKSLDLVYGFTLFHSSFIGVIMKYAEIYDLDPKDLIIEYTKIDKLNIKEDLLDGLAESLSKKSKKTYNFKIESTIIKKTNNKEQLKALCKELLELKHKYNKKVFFNIAQSYEKGVFKISPVIHNYENISFANAEVKIKNEVMSIINQVKNYVNGFLIDVRTGVNHSEDVNNAFYYDDAELFATAIHNYIINTNMSKLYQNYNVFIDERNEIKNSFLEMYGNRYQITKNLTNADIAVIGHGDYNKKKFELAKKLKWVIITNPDAIENKINMLNNKIRFIRIDLKCELFNEIIKKMNYSNLICNEYGVKKIGKIIYCSGGFIGPKGAIVVDNVQDIKKKYGVSNGDGSINYFTK